MNPYLFLERHAGTLIGDLDIQIPKEKLNETIDCMIHAIHKKKASTPKQPCIAIYLDRSAYYIVSIFATWKMGAYFVPLNTSWPKNRCDDLIDHCQADIVICSKKGSYHKSNALYIENISFDALSVSYETATSKASDLCYIIYTSGSTGEPKGVMISNESYIAYIEWTRRFFSAYSAHKHLLITAELTFDITLGDIAFSLAFGTHIYVASNPKNSLSIVKMIMQFNIDTFYSVPTTHSMLLELCKSSDLIDISSIKLLISGGDSFSYKLIENFKRIVPHAHFYNVYGPTEVTINCFAIRLDNKVSTLKQSGIPIGHVFDHLTAYILNEQHQRESNPSEEGHLCIGGGSNHDWVFK